MSDDINPRPASRIAIHEAGHALAYCAFFGQGTLMSVSVEADSTSVGRAHNSDRGNFAMSDISPSKKAQIPHRFSSSAHRFELLVYGAYRLAGIAAELIVLGSAGSLGSYDSVGLLDLLQTDRVEGAQQLGDDCQNLAIHLLNKPAAKRALCEIAVALDKSKRINGATIARILESHAPQGGWISWGEYFGKTST